MMSGKVTGSKRLKEYYDLCPNFGKVYIALRDGWWPIIGSNYLQDGYLLWTNNLCIPRTSMGDFLIWKIHLGSLLGHFEHDKTIKEVESQFYWSSLKKDVAKLVHQC
jgi:hypothetical protein